MPHISEKNNLIYLAVGLVLLLFIGALVEHFPGDLAPRIIQATTVATLFPMSFSLKSSLSGFIISIAFVLVVLLSVSVGSILDKA